MRTPAGKECRYFYGDYYRGRNHEECRLLMSAVSPLNWTPDLCSTCPVPEILLANACEYLLFEPVLTRPFPYTRRKVSVKTRCTKTLREVPEPEIGCGDCHPVDFIFLGDPGGSRPTN